MATAPPVQDETMTEQFTCPICIEYMDQKIIICCNGHSICHKCAVQLDKCPTCKGRLDPNRRNFTLENAAKLFRNMYGKMNEEDVAVSEVRETLRTDNSVASADPTVLHWQAALDGQVPANAFAAGHDKSDTLYIARANFKGGVIVGKLHPRWHGAFIPWNYKEHKVTAYEVLCNFRGCWAECHGANIPPYAFCAGTSETGELLYVGRVQYDDTLTVGKVHPSHGVLYISYNGKELAFKDYEILCEI